MSANSSPGSWTNARVSPTAVVHPGCVLGRRPLAPPGTVALRPTDPGDPAVIGDGAVIGCNVVIYGGVRVGRNCLIGDGAVIREGTVVGDHTIVGLNAVVGPHVTIGRRSRVMDLASIVGFCRIGDGVFIAAGVHTANDNDMGRGDFRVAGVVVEDGARVGVGARLLPGVTVGADALVGAGSVVTRDVPPGMVVLGCPARRVRDVPPGHRYVPAHREALPEHGDAGRRRP